MRLKGLGAESVCLDLIRGDQFESQYHALNPQTAVPALVDGGGPPLVQSLAILEYLDETYPEPPLLPEDRRERAWARALAQMAAFDVHPFIVPRVRKYLGETLGLAETSRVAWVRHWLDAGSRAIEDVVARHPRSGPFCCGDGPTIADICLVAHLTSAQLFGARGPDEFPVIRGVFAACMRLDAFALEHPSLQPDAQAAAVV
jgi:maleylacetoacetate isomerase